MILEQLMTGTVIGSLPGLAGNGPRIIFRILRVFEFGNGLISRENVWLDSAAVPPDPSIGFQLHYGPARYDDPEEIKKYLIMPGEETTDCVFVKTPNEVEIFHSEYHGRMRPGSHHLLVYTKSTESPDSAGPEACNLGVDTAMILGAQKPKIDIDRSENPAPENDGMAQKLAPRAQAVLQMHYINTTSRPTLREAWANVVYTDPSAVKDTSIPGLIFPSVTHS